MLDILSFKQLAAEAVVWMKGIAAGVFGTVAAQWIKSSFFDRPNVNVNLQFGMGDQERPVGVVRVMTDGKQPVFITGGGIVLCGLFSKKVITRGRYGHYGQMLGKDKFVVDYPILCDELEGYSKHWKKFRGFAEDSTERRYYSKPALSRPSWAEDEPVFYGSEVIPSFESFIDEF